MRRIVVAVCAPLALLAVLSATARPVTAPSATVAAAQAADAPTAEALRDLVDQFRYAADGRAPIVAGEQIALSEAVARHYEASGFAPVWTDTARLDSLVAAIADLEYDGLRPTDYHVDTLQSFRGELRSGPLAPRRQAELEVVATDAMALALYHLYFGKVDPAKLSPQWNFPPRPLDMPEARQRFDAALADGDVAGTFERARPQHPWYQRGRERLRQYNALRDAGGWSAISAGPAIEPGASDPRVPALRHRLAMTGDLPSAKVDADGVPVVDAPLPPYDVRYDADLEAAVKRFQARHGLTADGVVGPGTLAALNVPVAARIDQIRVNLERARWVLHEIKGDFVLVDVAGFDVSWFRDDEPVWTSKVIVGRPYRETPIFRSTITYVVFNPTWTVPPGILVKDKLPVIQRDPGYLKKNNIRVIDSQGREVDPYKVNWKAYGPGRLPPYQLRQDPGDDNALGLVKIMFPNPYTVYLHDTPSKSLFDKDERTFSSGCIRVQKAFELAEIVLADPARWNQQTIAEVIAAKATKTVNLAQPIPVLILYWTAQPTPDGQVLFRNDVYGRDPPTLAGLDAPVVAIASTPRGR